MPLKNKKIAVIGTGNIGSAYAVERASFVDLFDTRDQAEGVNAFLEKRPPKWVNG